MPVAPLDSLELAVNTARVRVNDALANIGGDILTDSAVFTLTYINAAWRRFQEMLVNYGQSWFKPEVILAAVAAVGTLDPGSQAYINWSNYFNGLTLLAAPVLPQNFIAPLIVWERPAGNGSFYPMDRLDNGLPGIPKTAFNRSWEWRNGAIYLPGATQALDLRIRYAGFFADFVAANTTPFANQPIPILRAMNPLAWFIASEFSKARGDMDVQYFDQQAQISTKFFFDLDPLQARSVGNEAEYQKMTDQYSATQGPDGPRGPQKGAA